MLRLAVDSGYLPAELALRVERVVARLPALCGPDPVPTLLHGDTQQNNFVGTADGAVVIDVAPYFGHPEADLAFVDILLPGRIRRCWAPTREFAPVDPGFAGRRELWRLPGYLAVIAVSGGATSGGRSCRAWRLPWRTTRNTDNSKKRSRRKSAARVIPRETVTIKTWQLGGGRNH